MRKIVVLAGGLSAERNVSLSTGTKVCQALRDLGQQAALVDVYLGCPAFDGDWADFFATDHIADVSSAIDKAVPDIEQIRTLRQPSDDGDFGPNVIRACQAADIVFMALHGENGENGRLQAAFDLLGIKYTGTGYLGSALAMHKDLTKLVLSAHGIATPRGVTYQAGDPLEVDQVRLPSVVKPCSNGSSIGVSIARTVDELRQAIAVAAVYGADVLIEDYIQGREFSVGVLGESALPVIEIIPHEGFYDYETKYQADAAVDEVCPAALDATTAVALQTAALSAHRGLHLEVYSRVDLILSTSGDIYCLEANTLPGMTPTSLIPQEAAVVGLSYGALCQRIIELSLAKDGVV